MTTGPGETVGDRLAGYPDIWKIGFTGSSEVGKLVQKKAAENLEKVTLELGGKGPKILLDEPASTPLSTGRSSRP